MIPGRHRERRPEQRAATRVVQVQVTARLLTTFGLAVTMVGLGRLITATITQQQVTQPVAMSLTGVGLAMVTTWFSSWVTGRAVANHQASIRQLALVKLFDLGPVGSLDDEPDGSGAMVSLLTDGIERLSKWEQGFRGPMLGAMVSPIVVLGVLAVAIDPLSALVLACCVPFVPLTVGGFQRAFRKVSGESRRAKAHLASRFMEAIQGLVTLTVLGATAVMGQRLAEAGERNRRHTMSLLARNQLVLLVADLAFSLFMVSASGAIAWWRLLTGQIDAGGALGIVLLGVLLCAPMEMIGGFFYIGMSGRAASRRIDALLDIPSTSGTTAIGESTGLADQSMIAIRGLNFAYPGRSPVLIDLDLDVPRGHRITILGASGSGKSTLLSLLAGDLVPDDASLKINGVLLAPKTRDLIRSTSALVNQHTWLFRTCLAENLRVGAPKADDRELWDALDAVGLADWARRLPAGLDTQVGEQGVAVSGGQAQRLSLARAIVSGRQLLLLDEPTSQVDLESERVIMEAINSLTDRTIVMTTHRATAIRPADRLLTMVDGHLEETHQ